MLYRKRERECYIGREEVRKEVLYRKRERECYIGREKGSAI